MNLQAVEMDPNAAREAFLQYREAFRKTASETDEALMRGYKEIANGRRIIYLPDTIKAGGVTPEGLPKLAIARADSEWADCEVWKDGRVSFMRRDMRSWSRMIEYVKLPPGTLQGTAAHAGGRAMVPLIPPQFRPPYDLKGYHILWEAEWKPIPPRDPALLKSLGGGLYAVLAVWDLTELEMMVLGMARRSG
jgi:hypothetical protein